MASTRKIWLVFGVAQLLGCLLDFVGASYSIAAQLLGLALLLPGCYPANAISHFIAYHQPWREYLWTRDGMDEEGLTQMLYLPTAVVLNVTLLSGFLAVWSAKQRGTAFDKRS